MAGGEKRGGGAGAGALGGAGCGAGAGALAGFAPGAGGPAGLLLPPPVAATALAALLLLALYRLTACPGLPAFALPPDKGGLPAPTYLLLLPGNASALPPPYSLHLLPADDRDTLIDVRPFSFRAPGPDAARACGAGGGDAPLLLVLVHSAPANADKRRTIRDTWASPAAAPPGRAAFDGRLRVLFMLGAVDDAATQRALDRENQLHGDLVQGSFRDSYRNMTYKHVMTLKWAAYHCPGALYVLKTDDDVFVNSPELLRFLARELSPWGARRLILCVALPYSYVKRSWRSKWRVGPKEFPSRLYPPFCVGWAVLYSPDAVFLLYREAQRGPYFWIDDVHVTGTLAARVNLSQTPLLSLALTRLQMEALVDAPPGAAPPPYAAHFLFGSPDMHEDELYKLWDYVQRGRS